MYLDSKKGWGLVLGPVKPNNPQGDYFVLREDLSIFRIHYYELSQQGESILQFKQSNSRHRYLGFDNYSGDLLLVRSSTKTHLLGLTLRKLEPPLSAASRFSTFCYMKTSISRAPSSFIFAPEETIFFTFKPDA